MRNEKLKREENREEKGQKGRTEKREEGREGWRNDGLVGREFESLLGAMLKILCQENKSDLENAQETAGNITLETDRETQRREFIRRLKICWNQCGNKHPVCCLSF